MDAITAQHLRDNWRSCREAAAYDDKAFVVTYVDTPFAVLLSPQTWRRGLERVPHSGHDELGVRASRAALRRVFNAARQGRHTVITRHGDEDTVIAPYAWAREALPELDLAASTTRGQNTVRPEHLAGQGGAEDDPRGNGGAPRTP